MEMQLRLVVHWKKIIYDDLIVTSLQVTRYVKKPFDNDPCDKNICDVAKRPFVCAPNNLNNQHIHSYAVSAYIDTLKRSYFYRQCATRPFVRCKKLRAATDPVILINLRLPKKQFLDYKWGERLTRMALERREVDYAMSWLSTLGGAFSALGEHFHHCAEMAGKISLHQFKLALRLGDPLLVARCKLYAALSKIQQGYLRIPRLMIKDIFKFAVEQRDVHLQRMCQGVWAKLRYCYQLNRQRRKRLRE